MRIFKFGGASVKDAEGVRNLVNVLKETGHEKTLIIVSAMGKTTNAIEIVVNKYFNNKSELQSAIQDVRKFHNAILFDLFDNENMKFFQKYPVYSMSLHSFLIIINHQIIALYMTKPLDLES